MSISRWIDDRCLPFALTQQPSAKAELDSLRSIVARCFSDVAAKGLSTDARFIMAYDAA